MTPAGSGRSVSVREVSHGTALYQDALSCVNRRFGNSLEHRVDELVRARQAVVAALTESATSDRALAVLAQSTQMAADGRSSEILALVNRHPSSWAKRGYGSRLLAEAERTARGIGAGALMVREPAEMASADRVWLDDRGFRRSEAEGMWIKRLETDEVRAPSPRRQEDIIGSRKRCAEGDSKEHAPAMKMQRREEQVQPVLRAVAGAVASSSSASAAGSSGLSQQVPFQTRRHPEGLRGGRGGFAHAARGGHRPQGPREPLRMTLKEPYLSMISRGQKTWEGRLNRGAFARVRVGEEMVFFNHTGEVRVRIDEIQYSRSFEEMVRGVGYNKLVPNVASERDAVGIYRTIYGVQDQGCGCVALRLTVLSAKA